MVHSLAMTQIADNLMEKTLQLTVPWQQSFLSWFNKEMLWLLRYLEIFFLLITKYYLAARAKIINCERELIYITIFVGFTACMVNGYTICVIVPYATFPGNGLPCLLASVVVSINHVRNNLYVYITKISHNCFSETQRNYLGY